MKNLQFKRDPLVIIPYTLFTLGLFVVLAMKLITWKELLVGLAALNLPAVFGLTRGSSSNDEDDSDPPSKTPSDGRGLTSIALLIGAGALLFGLEACGYGKTACDVIDIADKNCVWLKYLEEDGSKREVKLTPQEARDFGRAMAKKRALEQHPDGGAP